MKHIPATYATAVLTSIHDAIRLGELEQLEAMVSQGASLNEIDLKHKFTPVHWAAHSGSLECLHWLLWHGADATVKTPNGWTPVHLAAIKGQEACIEALVNNGASLSCVDNRGNTPAHLAAAHGHSSSLACILRSGTDLSLVDQMGWTVVHAAAFHGRLGCLQVILKWGAPSDEVDNSGNTPAHLAASEGHLHCLKYIVSTSPTVEQALSARNDNGETPKMLAHQFYKQPVVDYIEAIEYERDHPEDDENLAFPCHVAAYNGDLAHVQMLVENGIVTIDERDQKGATPAHKAAGQGHTNVLQWLIEMGANMELTNSSGETPKDVARRFAQLGCLVMLGGKQEELGGDSPPLAVIARRNRRHLDELKKMEAVEAFNHAENRLDTVVCKVMNSGTEVATANGAKFEKDIKDTKAVALSIDDVILKNGKSKAEKIMQGNEDGTTDRNRVIKEDEGGDGDNIDGGGVVGDVDNDDRRSDEEDRDSEMIRDGKMSKAAMKKAKARSHKQVEDLMRQLDIAKRNYRQFGGVLPEDERQKQFNIELEKTIDELRDQLEYERLRREKLESDINEYRREIARLNAELARYQEADESDGDPHESAMSRQQRRAGSAKKSRKKKRDDNAKGGKSSGRIV